MIDKLFGLLKGFGKGKLGDVAGDFARKLAADQLQPRTEEALQDLSADERAELIADLEAAVAHLKARNANGKTPIRKAARPLAEVLALLAEKMVTD